MERIKKITPANKKAANASRELWNSIAKPLGGLGQLEELIIKMAGITGYPHVRIPSRAAVIMCADNGVVKERVTQSESSVTAIAAESIANGFSSISRMAACFVAETIVIDIGMNKDSNNTKIIRRKTAYGTNNIAVGAAMTVEQAKSAICAGMDIVKELSEKGVKIIVSGEMGIGNTTTAAAIACILLNEPPEKLTGRGAGLDSTGLKRKIEVIRRAIAVNKPERDKPIELLAKLGGFDIAGMTGLFLGGAVYHIPVVIDGVISAVSAALAAEISPDAKDYMLPSHVSEEPAGSEILKLLEFKAPIHAGMRLGEGTGGIMLLPLLDGALAVYNEASRFKDLNMESYKELK